MRGFSVSIGKIGDREVDFIAEKNDDKCYIQVAYLLHQEVTISNSYTVVWGCKVEGYYTESGALVATMDSVLVKILCNPIGSIRIKVKGVVVDSLTRKPVGDAMIILQTTYHDVEKDSSYTDDNGIFSRSIMMGQTSSDIPSVLYQIVAEGYVEKWGNMRIPLESSASMDLDTLALLKTSIVSYASQRNSVQTVKSLNYRMFTLNGRMLFGKNGAMRSQGNGRPRASQTIYIVNESKKAVKIITFD